MHGLQLGIFHFSESRLGDIAETAGLLEILFLLHLALTVFLFLDIVADDDADDDNEYDDNSTCGTADYGGALVGVDEGALVQAAFSRNRLLLVVFRTGISYGAHELVGPRFEELAARLLGVAAGAGVQEHGVFLVAAGVQTNRDERVVEQLAIGALREIRVVQGREGVA